MTDLTPADYWRDRLLRWTAPPPETAPTGGDGWRVHADRFRAVNQAVRGREEPFTRFLSPWLGPDVSVLDVGAGGGRFALPLAERVGHLTAVEPSEGMRAVLTEALAERGFQATIVAARWPEAQADLPPADVVVCANVAYDVANLAPFVGALDRAARRWVAIYMTLTHPVGHIGALWREFRGWEVPQGPTYLDAAAVVFSLGIPTNITLLPVEPTLYFADWDAAVAGYRARLGLQPDAQRDQALRAALATFIKPQDGRLVAQPHQRQAAVLWWEKETRE